MLTNFDFEILVKKLDSFDEKLKKLEQEVTVFNAWMETQLRDKYHPNTTPFMPMYIESVDQVNQRNNTNKCAYDGVPAGTPMGLVCTCPKHSAYALNVGSFVDAGVPQQWRESINATQDVEE